MTIIVGVRSDESGMDAVALGAVLCKALDREIVLVHVHPPTINYPSVGNVDAEWTAYLDERSRSILASAQEYLASDWDIGTTKQVAVAHSSVGRGLLEAAESNRASLVVLGPGAPVQKAHVSLGSAAHSLLHGGHVGVALAPQGYRKTAPALVHRLVVAFRDGPDSEQILRWSMDVARRKDLALALLSVVLRVTRVEGARLGHDPERAVIDALVEQHEEAQREVISRLDATVTGAVVCADTADQAMRRFPWHEGDLLVLGSSRYGVVRRVLLGDTGMKILRAATVPALVLPRETFE